MDGLPPPVDLNGVAQAARHLGAVARGGSQLAPNTELPPTPGSTADNNTSTQHSLVSGTPEGGCH